MKTVGEFFRMSRNKTLSLEADEDLAYLLTHIGEDNMIMGSDYGHQDQSKEDGTVGVMRRKKSMAPAVIEKVSATTRAASTDCSGGSAFSPLSEPFDLTVTGSTC